MPVVTITMAKGRSYQQKKELTDRIAIAVKDVLGVPIERITIHVHELEKENISIAGALLSEQK
jgi:4-oxalocrotonate tautomerase